MLVMGPWPHGGWSRSDGDRLGNVRFGGKQSAFYREQIEFKFFEENLRPDAQAAVPTPKETLPEAYVFETGANRWRTFPEWPPKETAAKRFFLRGESMLSVDDAPTDAQACDRIVSDPKKPVPFTEAVATGMTREYMTDDQRFAARRPDVLCYETPPLDGDVTFAGPLLANLWVATSQQDADWIVKLVDVFPGDFKYPAEETKDDKTAKPMGGYAMMVRSEVIRGRFRDGYSDPKPFTPNEPTLVKLPLQDVLHTFQKGHRIMFQVQSSWFPLVDRNPQKWVDNIYQAADADFVAAEHRLFREAGHASFVEVGVLPAAAAQSTSGG
jgi:putative CocE/NonD family hydrolase